MSLERRLIGRFTRKASGDRRCGRLELAFWLVFLRVAWWELGTERRIVATIEKSENRYPHEQTPVPRDHYRLHIHDERKESPVLPSPPGRQPAASGGTPGLAPPTGFRRSSRGRAVHFQQ